MAEREGGRAYFGDDFGQKIDLTVRIREILRNYPEGTSIFKEMVQNADDAGATEVAFCLDLRQHPTEGLAYDKMAKFQGPSLVVFNNATFTDADFQSIQRIGDSLKKDTSKGWKTGRFGVGFNSVYHLTDLPAFVSGSHLVFFDPQACHLPNVNPSNPGKIIDFLAHPQLVQDFPSQVAPFRVFGCDFATPFKGTVFRLALRSEEQARDSRLSSREQTPTHMLEMLQEFADSTELVLLFLRNVAKIKILRWDVGADQPTLMYETSLGNITEEVKAKRSLRTSMVGANASSHRQFNVNGHICDYHIEISVSKAGCDPKIVQYFIANQLGGGECSQIANNPANAGQRLVPWGGVAVRIPAELESTAAQEGLAFCFLPLPTHTHLPVHVNGYFELSSNRRDIWFGEGLSGDGLLRAQWNKALLEYVVAPCYARALICMTDTKIMPPHMHATLFPQDVPPEPWDILCQSTLNIVRTQPCLFTTANGGAWVAPMDALIVRRTSEDYEDFVRWLLQDSIPIVTTLSDTVENVLIKSKVVSGFLLPKVLRSQYAGRDSLHAGNLDAIKSVLGFMARDLDGMTLGELSGIRLLPLCDGSLSTFWKPSEGGDAARLDHLCSMGFTRAQSLRALQMTGNESVEIALNWLISNPPMPTASGDDDSPAHSTYFIPSDEERVIFSRAKNRLVDTKALPSTVKKLLSSNARAPLNVRAIDTDGFEDLLSVIFPREWYGKMCVPWKSDEEAYSNFSEEWIRRFWQYVGPSTRLRSLQSKWPILPTESGFLYSLSSTSGVVSPELLPASCIAALTKIGVPLLLKNLFAAFQPHIDIWNYVHQPTPGGLLSSVADLCNAPELEVKKSFRSVTGHEREQLMQFLLADGCKDLDSTQRLALSKIPIFRGIIPLGQVVEYDVTWTEASDDEKQLSGHSPVYVGLDGAGSSGPRSVCQGIKWHFLDKHFVSVKDDDSSMMDSLSCLSVRSITKAKFLADFLVPRLSGMSVDFRIDFTCHLLRDLSSWLADDISGDLLRLIETEPLFPAMNGEPKRIGDLFDPEIEAFSKIMDESFYPAIELQEPQPLSVLRSLGLQRYLSRRSILALACSIDAEQAKIMSRDCEDEQLSELTSALRLRAIEFFKYLDVQMDQLVAVSKPERTTKKKNVKEKGLRFWRSIVGETGSASNERRIGMQSEEMEEQLAIERREIDDFIAKLEVIAWAPVAHHLGFSLPRHSEDPRLVVSPPEHVRLPKYQFLCSSQFHILGHDLRSDTLRERFKWSQLIPVEVIAKQLKAIVTSHKSKAHSGGEWSALYEIYRRLSRFFEAEPDTELRERVLAVLSGDFDFIWVGDKFVAPHQVALSTRVNAEPYLFGVSSEMAHFRPFLKAVGVRERFSTTDYVEALARMHENTQLQSTDEGQKRFLSTDEQIAAIGLVQLICDSLSHHTDYELFVPDARGMLMRSVELSFDDAPWLDKREIDLEAVQLIHPKISNEVATKIGARSLRSLLLHANQTESLLFSTAGDMEAFGQTEAITKRISHILEQYPDGPHIISELIQNADDAGANRVCIMYSGVTFGSSSLLSPAMSKWQGPALYCYNDAEFQDSDFISLARLGQGGKLQKVSTTGRFGLGFNSVYHFTDLPSVISATALVMFDPHATHLPVTPANPGIRVRFVNSSLPHQFPDQFEPFKVFGCDLQSHFHGSLFRFPLRHKGLASMSEIKQRAYGTEEILSLFESFRSTIAETMLFLRNVRKVDVMMQTTREGPPLLLYSSEVPESERGDAWRQIDRFIAGESTDIGSVSKAAIYSRLARIPAADLPSISQTLRIHTRERKDLDQLLRSGTLGTNSRLEVFPGSEDIWATRTEEYLVCNQLGGGRAREMACAQENANLKLIPWVGVAGRLQESVVEGRAFCFLPLPVRTTLPVHVNGYFELSSNRRDIWHGEDLSGDGKLRSEWNASLLEDAIAPAYVNFLLEAKQLCGRRGTATYMSLFPVKTPSGPWGDLVKAVYAIAKDKPVLSTSLSALNNAGKPINPAACVLVDESVHDWETLEIALNSVFVDTVRVSASLRKIMVDCDIVRGSFTPTFFRKLVRSGNFLSSLDQHKATKVIQFCISDTRDASARTELNQLALVPTLNGAYKPLVVYEATHTDPAEFESALFFANELESGLLNAFQDRLVDYQFKPLFGSVSSLDQHSNLFRMTPRQMTRWFLPRVLPAEWHQRNHATCPLEPTAQVSNFSRDWLRSWWEYVEHVLEIATTEQESKPIEEALTSWPLLPVVPVDGQPEQVLLRASSSFTTGVVQHHEFPLSAELVELLPAVLRKLGVASIDVTVVGGRQTVAWVIKNKLLFQLNLNGVLSALAGRFNREQASVEGAFTRLDTSEMKIFEDFVTSGVVDQIDGDNMALLRKLPIFRVHTDQGSEESFRSIDNAARLAGENADIRVLGPQYFVAPPKSPIRNFLEQIGVEAWSFTRILLEDVFPRLEILQRQAGSELVTSIVQAALLELPYHQRQEPSFRDAVKELPIVFSRKMQLRRVQDLYDPNNRDLGELVGVNSLPSMDFADENMVAILRSLGLRDRLSCHAILESARSIETMAADDVPTEETWKKAQSLLKLVNRSFDDLVADFQNGSPGAEDTATTDGADAIVASLRTIKWLPIHETPFKSLLPWPRDSTPGRKFASAETTRPESDMWKCSFTRDILTGQLKSEVLLAGFGWDLPVEAAVVASQLAAIGELVSSSGRDDVSSPDFKTMIQETQQLYGILDEACSRGDPEAIESLSSVLESSPWVWTGKSFARMQQLALDTDSELEPLLFAAPPEILVPRSLLTTFGLKQEFAAMDYVLALRSLSQSSDLLTPTQRTTCVKLFDRIASSLSTEGASSTLASTTFMLLDESGRLVPARDLVYDDMEWNESSEIRRGCRFVSRSLTRDVALTLGAKSLHSRLAETAVNSTKLVCPPVRSLQKVLPRRDQWFDVFFREILLAVERLEGSQIDFFVDYRKHPSQRVIQPSFQVLQEEAFCVHIHDVVLSTQDVNKLYGGEMARPGFLTGFTFSDCLQILSGDGFFVLDPTNQILATSGTSNSGTARRYDILGEDFQRYPDQLLPFATLPSLSGNVNRGTKGTLLRFPWRKKASDLSSYILSAKAAERFIKFVQMQLRDCLVFTESVHRVALWGVGKASEYEQLRHGEVSLESGAETIRQRTSTRRNNDWKKKFSFQSFFKAPVTPESQLEFRIDVEIENKRYKDIWLLSDNIGAGRSRDLAGSPVHEVLNSTPYVSVACHLLRDGKPPPPVRGKLFKIVKSNQDVGLPIHINGCFKKNLNDSLVHFNSARSGQNDDQAIATHWNRVLLEDGVVEAYSRLLHHAKRLHSQTFPRAFYRVWPVNVAANNFIASQVQQQLFRKLETQDLFLCSDGTYRSLREGYVVDTAGMDLQVVSFAQLHFPSFNVPSNVLDDAKRLLPARVYSLAPTTMRRFLRNVRSADIHPSMCLSLLEYCLSDVKFPLPADSNAVWSEFQGLPLLPLQDGSVGILGINRRGRHILASYNQIQLLPSLASTFVSLEARQRLHAYFSEPRFVTQMGLSQFSIKTLADNIHTVLPAAWRDRPGVDWSPGTDGEISQLWMHRFWSEVRFERRSLAYFSTWPLIPVHGSRLLSCGKPGAAVCVWDGAFDQDLREQVNRLASEAALENEEKLVSLEVERKRLLELSTLKVAEEETQYGRDNFEEDEDMLLSGDPELDERAASEGEVEIDILDSLISVDGETIAGGEVEEQDTHSIHDGSSDHIAGSDGAELLVEVDVPADTTNEAIHELDEAPSGTEAMALVVADQPVTEYVETCSRPVLHDMLHRLGVPILELAYLAGQETEIIPASRDVAIAILDATHECDQAFLKWQDLTGDDAMRLAEFFANHGQRHGGFNRMQIDMLKQLPIYVNICGEPCALHQGEHFLVPSEIDLRTIPLPPNARERFLQPNPHLTELYRDLNVQDMSYGRLLIFVLPYYSHLTEEQRVSMLELIKEKWPTLRGDAGVVDVLRTTRLFASDDGSLQCADAFFDPRNKVFATLYANTRGTFPCEPMRSSSIWLDLMGEIGLRSEISVDLFVECAKRLESLYADKTSLSLEDEMVVNTLHEFFVQNFDKYDRSRVFFEQITSIRFVPAIRHHHTLAARGAASAMSTETVLATYAECAIPEDQALVFSCMPIVSPPAFPPRVLWSRLGLQSPPPKDLVLKNLLHIVDHAAESLSESWLFYVPLVDVFQAIFKYLQDEWERLTSSEREKLMHMTIIPVGSSLVKGSRLFFHLAENLAPIMFEVPRAFGAYDTLFRRLGSKESPATEDYVVVLRDLAEECRDGGLNLNELLSVSRIVSLLADDMIEQNKALSDETMRQLYLPSTDSTMRPALAMAYNDAPWICSRVDLTELQLVHPRVTPDRCDVLGVKGISQVVSEQLDAQGHALHMLAPPPPEIERMNAVIASQQFGNGLRTVISVQHQKSTATTSGAVDFDELHTRIVGVGDYQIRAVDTLRSRFLAQLGQPPRPVDVTKASTAAASVSFVDSRGKTIYVAVETLAATSGVRVTQVVAGRINQLLGGAVQDCSVIESMLSCDAPGIQPLLQLLQIHDDPTLIAEKLRGAYGELLSERDRQLVELVPLRSFYVGEVVAVDHDGELRYAKIMKEEPSGNGGLSRFEVRVRQAETAWFLATQIYSFKSFRGNCSSEANTTWQSRNAAFVDRLGLATGDTSMSAETRSVLPPSVAVRDISQRPGALPSAVSPVTVVSAVNDLLSKLNLSLDSTFDELLTENLRLQRRLEQAEEGRRLATAQVETAVREKKDAEESLVCMVCLEHKVDRVLIPCGHIYCSMCIAQLPRRTCPVCRQAIASTSQFHVPS